MIAIKYVKSEGYIFENWTDALELYVEAKYIYYIIYCIKISNPNHLFSSIFLAMYLNAFESYC